MSWVLGMFVFFSTGWGIGGQLGAWIGMALFCSIAAILKMNLVAVSLLAVLSDVSEKKETCHRDKNPHL